MWDEVKVVANNVNQDNGKNEISVEASYWYSEYFNKDAKYEMPLMELKRGETIYYDDGTVEEYRSDYHKTFKTYVTEDCEVYTLFEDGEFGKKIPMEKLSYIGNGEIIDNFFSIADTGIKVAAFRQDAVAVI